MEKETNQPSRGLGDTVAKVTHVLKLDVVAQKAAQAVGKKDCGCKRRQEKLNELVPYNKKENQS